MQITTVIAVAVAAYLPSVLAANAIVINNCSFPAYVQSVSNGQPAGPLITLAPNGSIYSEAFKTGGTAIKVGWHPQLSGPLTFEYTPSNGLVYYDISNNAGNPFSGDHNTLVTSDKTCTGFDCAPNNASCYSSGSSLKIQACQSTTDLTLKVCAP